MPKNSSINQVIISMFERSRLLLLLFGFLLSTSLEAQTGACPVNIDFEFGNFQNWQTNVGTVANVGSTNVITFPAYTWLDNLGSPGRQVLQDRNSTTPSIDQYGGFPVNPVNGGRYSLKLGSDADDEICNGSPCPGSRAEAARYIINVPANATNFSITFSYAVVLENPLDAVNVHKDEEQPRFNVKMYDPVTNEVIPCANFGFMASGPLPGFDTSTTRKHPDAVVKFKPWSSVYVGLSRYAGRTLYLEFTTADCTKGGHFGYAYVDVIECGVAAKTDYLCVAPNTTKLIGPPGFASYQWYDASFSTLIGTTQDVVINPGPALGTQYWVIATPYSNTGCPTCDCRDTIGVKVAPNYPKANAGVDKTICPGSTVTLGSAPITGYSYQWSPAINLSNPQGATTMVTASSPASYVLTVTDTLGCVGKDTVLIDMLQTITLRVAGDTICSNESTILQASGGQTYAWSPATGLSSTTIANPVANPPSTTTYTVIACDSVKCYSDTASLTVLVKPAPTVSLGADLQLASGSFTTLTPTFTNGPITSWLWTPSTSLSCFTCETPVAEIKRDITYTVTATNLDGCKGSDAITIKSICANGQVYIPNAFTPDGDGVNDVFMIQGRGIYAVKSFRIFNRWGELIFEKLNTAPNNPAYGWDGKIRGVVGPPDVFVYTAEVICGNNEVFLFKGNVSVLR